MDVMLRRRQLMAMQSVNKNLAPPMSDWRIGYIGGGGSFVADGRNGERTSPFIPIIAGQTYKFSYTLENMPTGKLYWSCIVYYVKDTEQSMLGSRTTNGTQTQCYDLQREAPAGTQYVRVSVRTYNCITHPELIQI